ncbi:MAG: hypothetical protein ABIA04_08855 [Pseudomonadota bacterium]
MKKLFIILFSLLTLLFLSCFEQSQDQDNNDDATSDTQETDSYIAVYIDFDSFLENETIFESSSIIDKFDISAIPGIIIPTPVPIPGIYKSSENAKEHSYTRDNLPALLWVASNVNLSTSDLSSDDFDDNSWLSYVLPDESTWIAKAGIKKDDFFYLFIIIPTCDDLSTCILEQDQDLIFPYVSYYGEKQFTVNADGEFDIGDLDINSSSGEITISSTIIPGSQSGIVSEYIENGYKIASFTGESIDDSTITDSDSKIFIGSYINDKNQTSTENYLKCSQDQNYNMNIDLDDTAEMLLQSGEMTQISFHFWINIYDNFESNQPYFLLTSGLDETVISDYGMFRLEIEEDSEGTDEFYLSLKSLDKNLISEDNVTSTSLDNSKLIKNNWYFILVSLGFSEQDYEPYLDSTIYVFNELLEYNVLSTSVQLDGDEIEFFGASLISDNIYVCGTLGYNDQGAIPNVYIDDIYFNAQGVDAEAAESIFEFNLIGSNHWNLN